MKNAFRLLLLGTMTAFLLVGLWALCAPGIHDVSAAALGSRTRTTWTLDRVVGDGAACLTMLAAAAAATAGAWVVVSELIRRGASGPAAAAPSGAFRRSVLTLCGLTITAAPMAPALATDATPSAPPGQTSCGAGLSGLVLPDLPLSNPVRDHAPVSRQPHVVVIRPGDSLWSIAETLAAPHASDHAVALVVDELVALNRGRVGPNTDLIFPGTPLTTPEASHEQ